VKTRALQLGDIVLSADPGFASGENPASGVVQLRMNNVSTDGAIDWSEIRRVPANGRKAEKYALAPGDVVFNSTNSPDLVGKTALFSGFKEPVVFSNHFLRIRIVRETADPGYVARWFSFQWKRRTFENLCTRWVNQASVRKDDLLDLPMSLPELPEQRRVAARLEQADRLVRTREYALELTDTFLPAAFLELFGDPAENPRVFDRVQVEGLFAHSRDGAKCGPFGSALKKHEYVAAGIPVWTMNNVSANEFVEDGCLYITPQKFEELAAYDVQNGDILISRAGTVGRMAIVRTMHPCSIIHSNIIRLSLNHTKILPIYFVALMTWFAPRVARLKRGQEDAYTFMSTGSLGELQIPLPPFPLQQKFAALVERVERLRAVQREALRQAEHLFASLLGGAFSV